jgi:dephospho-CoA kinase
MRRVIITGNIGSGKSTATKIFQDSGYKVIDTDYLNARILKQYHTEITKMFSLPPQSFDTFKKTLSNRVFQNKDDMKKLESFMIPRVKLDIDFWCDLYESEKRKYVVEIPTFFEANGLKSYDDYIILVRAPDNVRAKRILMRNPHLTESDVADRMNAQIDQDRKERFCDGVINNDSDYESLNISVNAQKYIYERDN